MKTKSIFILLLFLLTSCTPYAPSQLGNILNAAPATDVETVKDNPACQTLCWKTLKPGLSTEADVKAFVDARDVKESPDASEYDYTPCKSFRIGNNHAFINLVIQNGILIHIDKAANVMPSTLAQLIQLYGPPEYTESLLAIGPDGQFYILNVYYPHLGLTYELSPDQNRVGKIYPNMQIKRSHYYSPGQIEDYFWATELSCQDKDAAKKYLARDISWLQPWTGYGDIQVIQTR